MRLIRMFGVLPAMLSQHAEGKMRVDDVDSGRVREPARRVVSFGPHSESPQWMVALVIKEAPTLAPTMKTNTCAAFQFDADASNGIDETRWPSVMLLTAQIKADMLARDVDNRGPSNERFQLTRPPDPAAKHIVAAWVGSSSEWLDRNYHDRLMLPQRVLFCGARPEGGSARLARDRRMLVQSSRRHRVCPVHTRQVRREAVTLYNNRRVETLKCVELQQ